MSQQMVVLPSEISLALQFMLMEHCALCLPQAPLLLSLNLYDTPCLSYPYNTPCSLALVHHVPTVYIMALVLTTADRQAGPCYVHTLCPARVAIAPGL